MNFTEKDIENCKKIYSKLSEKKFNKLLKKQDDLKLSSNLRSTLQKLRQNGGSYDMIPNMVGDTFFGRSKQKAEEIAKAKAEEIARKVEEEKAKAVKKSFLNKLFTSGPEQKQIDIILEDENFLSILDLVNNKFKLNDKNLNKNFFEKIFNIFKNSKDKLIELNNFFKLFEKKIDDFTIDSGKNYKHFFEAYIKDKDHFISEGNEIFKPFTGNKEIRYDSFMNRYLSKKYKKLIDKQKINLSTKKDEIISYMEKGFGTGKCNDSDTNFTKYCNEAYVLKEKIKQKIEELNKIIPLEIIKNLYIKRELNENEKSLLLNFDENELTSESLTSDQENLLILLNLFFDFHTIEENPMYQEGKKKKQDELNLSNNLRSTLQKIRQDGGSYDMIANMVGGMQNAKDFLESIIDPQSGFKIVKNIEFKIDDIIAFTKGFLAKITHVGNDNVYYKFFKLKTNKIELEEIHAKIKKINKEEIKKFSFNIKFLTEEEINKKLRDNQGIFGNIFEETETFAKFKDYLKDYLAKYKFINSQIEGSIPTSENSLNNVSQTVKKKGRETVMPSYASELVIKKYLMEKHSPFIIERNNTIKTMRKENCKFDDTNTNIGTFFNDCKENFEIIKNQNKFLGIDDSNSSSLEDIVKMIFDKFKDNEEFKNLIKGLKHTYIDEKELNKGDANSREFIEFWNNKQKVLLLDDASKSIKEFSSWNLSQNYPVVEQQYEEYPVNQGQVPAQVQQEETYSLQYQPVQQQMYMQQPMYIQQ